MQHELGRLTPHAVATGAVQTLQLMRSVFGEADASANMDYRSAKEPDSQPGSENGQ